MHFRNWPEKTVDIWRCYHWFPREKTTEKHAQKFHTDTRHYRIWAVLLIGCSIFLTNQKHYLDLGSDMSSVWNFCSRSWDVISRENQCWCRKMSALFSRDRRTYLTINDQGRPGFLGIRYTGAFQIGYTVYCSLNTGIRYITFFEFQV